MVKGKDGLVIPTAGLVEIDRSFFRNMVYRTQDAKGWFTTFEYKVQDANREALKWMQKEAAKNLRNSIRQRGRPQSYNTGRLLRAIENPANHEADRFRIRFMIDDRVRPDVPYYGALEFGDDYWVRTGRKLPFAFMGGNDGRAINRPASKLGKARIGPFDVVRGSRDPVASGGGRQRGLRLVGPREYNARGMSSRRRLITIKRPVPAYLYATKASRDLIVTGTYEAILHRICGPAAGEMGAVLK